MPEQLIQMPVTPMLSQRMREVNLHKLPDNPEHFRWGCADCGLIQIAESRAELGEQLGAHLDECDC
jgi:hypothetical protein